MPSAAGGVIDRSVGHYAFRKLPTVPQPTSADFVPQITFRIPHFRKLPTPPFVMCRYRFETQKHKPKPRRDWLFDFIWILRNAKCGKN